MNMYMNAVEALQENGQSTAKVRRPRMMGDMLTMQQMKEMQGMGAFYDDWIAYVKNNPLTVAGVALGSAALAGVIVFLKRRRRASA